MVTYVSPAILLILLWLHSSSATPANLGEHHPQDRDGKVGVTKSRLDAITGALAIFKLNHGRFPKSLSDLREAPGYVKAIDYPPGGYLAFEPKDAWGRSFAYEVPGPGGKPYLLHSLGADGKKGGSGLGADLFPGGASEPSQASTGSWSELGGSGSGGGISDNPGTSKDISLAVDSKGLPVVAWAEDSAQRFKYEIYLKRWNGTAWQELAGSSTGAGISRNAQQNYAPSVAIDPRGHPVVAWVNMGRDNLWFILLKRWNGRVWEELAGSGSGKGLSNLPGGSTEPSLALDASGNPVVAWVQRSAKAAHVYLRRWDGKTWAELGKSATGEGISRGTGNAHGVRIKIGKEGAPVVSWGAGRGSTGQIYLRRWTGTTWMDLGGSGSEGGLSQSDKPCSMPALALDKAGNPIVAWNVGDVLSTSIHLRRWTGTRWEAAGDSASRDGVSTGTRLAGPPSLGVDKNGNLFLAWAGLGTRKFKDVFLRRWNGTAWAEMGGSASGGGITRHEGDVDSSRPRMALDARGRPILAWELTEDRFPDVFLRAWKGED